MRQHVLALTPVIQWVSESVGQSFIVSDWRLLSHLQALRACYLYICRQFGEMKHYCVWSTAPSENMLRHCHILCYRHVLFDRHVFPKSNRRNTRKQRGGVTTIPKWRNAAVSNRALLTNLTNLSYYVSYYVLILLLILLLIFK